VRTLYWNQERNHLATGALARYTGGLLGHRLPFGKPALWQRTTGRRGGLPRITALITGQPGSFLE
jgi:hypothetical protein